LRTAVRPGRPHARALLTVAASVMLLVAATSALILSRLLVAQTGVDMLTRELVASHVRSQMLASHRLDVASSDSHTVKPWFQGKLDFAPPAKDLTDRGYPLVGGRLDYLGERPVAAIVYRRRDHVINLFVWPSTPADTASPEQAARQGFHLVHWTSAGLTFWAVSDLNEPELRQFARLIQE
jgi:anti-sigma factor RsiW